MCSLSREIYKQRIAMLSENDACATVQFYRKKRKGPEHNSEM
jgi:hypothetical protein